MNTYLRRLRAFIEANPLPAYFLAGLLAIPLAGLVAFWHAGAWRTEHLRQVLSVKREELRGRTERAAEIATFKFETMHRLARLLASEFGAGGTLFLPGGVGPTNARLERIAGSMTLHRALLIDARGVCVASNDAGNANNLVGVSLADRDYVRKALAGGDWTQFVVGRVSTVPGFHFSSAVRANGKPIGVLALKIGLPTLAEQIDLPAGFITDAMGVVVVSGRPGILLSAVPGSGALELDARTCQERYQRDALNPLPLRREKLEGGTVYRYGEEDAPSLMHVVRLPGEDLVVYGLANLRDLLEQARQQYMLRLLSVFAGIALTLALAGCALVFMLRDRAQMRKLNLLNRELEELAQTDALTGCFNRRPFDALLAQELRRSTRSGQAFALALFDLDRFKDVNDTYGHAAGDAALLHVVALFRRELRDIDVLARLGGDEFAVLLPGTSEQGALEGVTRIAAKLGTTPLRAGNDLLYQGISAGVAAWQPGMSPASLQGAADRALYAAKHGGRGRVLAYAACCVDEQAPEDGRTS